MIKVYSTCPRPADMSARDYVAVIKNVAAWSERAGLCGMLVHADDAQVDPWLLAQVVIESSERLRPLVAVRPEHLHPYTMAKTVSSLAFLHGRPVHLNMLAGGTRGEPLGAGGGTRHDKRYAQTVEYVNLAMGLMRGECVTLAGEFYSVTNLRLTPAIPDGLLPEIIISGSSQAAMAAARAIGATAVKHPAPPGAEQTWMDAADRRFGVRIGIVARADSDEAWRIAHERFPGHPERIGRRGTRTGKADGYWLDPFHDNQAPCPYLVGTYEGVAQMIAHYVVLGSRTFILDIPPSENELAHVNLVFDAAQELAVA